MENFKIYIDRLKNGHTEKIEIATSPAFLEVEEKDLSFPEEVHVNGEAYLADDHLVAHLCIRTAASLPCSICNNPVTIPIDIRDHYTAEPLSAVPLAIFDLSHDIREAILLQVPQFIECNQGNCPERETIKKYLSETSSEQKGRAAQPVHYPFADLDKKSTE